ncbi:MAG TPA: outer membrane beta-barrel protein [Gemmatimonadaceae bacterium]|nr:outer membrane beta-barrel protein [Gemmatimonadaceae bacterium]
MSPECVGHERSLHHHQPIFIMRTLVSPVAAVALATSVAGADLQAQVLSAAGHRFGIAGGAALPNGDFGDLANTGWDIGGQYSFTPPVLPIGFRAELGYSRYGVKEEFMPSGVDANIGILQGVANAVWSPVGALGVAPYVIGGVGMYNVKVSAEADGASASEDETKVGLNGGAGIRFPLGGMRGFAEVRYHSIFTEEENMTFIPLRFGIEF